jgi:hypothetical protein
MPGCVAGNCDFGGAGGRAGNCGFNEFRVYWVKEGYVKGEQDRFEFEPKIKHGHDKENG